MYILLFKDIRKGDNLALQRIKQGKAKSTSKVGNEMLNKWELDKDNNLSNFKLGRPSINNGYEGEMYVKNEFVSHKRINDAIVETKQAKLIPSYSKLRATYKLPLDASLNEILNCAVKLVSPKDDIHYDKNGFAQNTKHWCGTKVLNVKIAIVNDSGEQLGHTLISTKTKGNLNIHKVNITRVACSLETKKLYRFFSRKTMQTFDKLKSSIDAYVEQEYLRTEMDNL